MSTNVGRVLRKQGRKRNWLARELGISNGFVTRLISGDRRWTPEMKRGAANALGVPEDVLFEERDDERNSAVESVNSRGSMS